MFLIIHINERVLVPNFESLKLGDLEKQIGDELSCNETAKLGLIFAADSGNLPQPAANLGRTGPKDFPDSWIWAKFGLKFKFRFSNNW